MAIVRKSNGRYQARPPIRTQCKSIVFDSEVEAKRYIEECVKNKKYAPTRHITFEERCKIKEMLLKNYSLYKIGKNLCRDRNSIVNEVKKCGGIDNYDPELGQKKTRYKSKELPSDVQQTFDLFPEKEEETDNLEQKIDIINMKLDLIFELLTKEGSNDKTNN